MVKLSSAQHEYTVFADESGWTDRFFGYGGVFLPSSNVHLVEAKLEAFCSMSGFAQREMSWKKCSKGEVDRYCEFARLLWEIGDVISPLDFRAMVVDTERNAFREPDFNCATDEDGFYKLYHFFLTASLRKVAPSTTAYQIVIGTMTDQYPHRDEILRATTGGALRNYLGPSFTVAEVERASPRHQRVHQLADVLTGCVTFAFNRADSGSYKRAILDAVEQQVGRSLTKDFLPDLRPFNIWAFAARGRRRWAHGASGRS